MKQPKHGIKHIRIEPATDGGFMTEVCHYPKPAKKTDGSNRGAVPIGLYDDNITKHVHANGKDLGSFISGLFPGASARSKKGISQSSSGDGSHIETYEGASDGGDEDEEDEEE